MNFIKIDYPEKEKVYLEAYLLDCRLKFGQSASRPAVIVCPGGGYVYLSPREAEPIALAYASRGIHAFVLNYSVGWDVKGFSPLEELEWAIKLIREHAEEWNIDPDKIVTCGFSAGGHLALAAGLLGEDKPNAVILGYPATDFSAVGDGMMSMLFTGRKETTEEVKKWMNLNKQVTADAPPLFMFATGEDKLTRKMTLDLVMAYEEKGLLCEYHLFQKGPHGFSLANAVSANGSSRVVSPHVEKWMDMSAEWLFSVLGEPVLEDFSTSHLMQAYKELGVELPEIPELGGNLKNA